VTGATPILLRSIGHVVYFSSHPERSAEFYVEKLGFRVTDKFEENGGVFLRAPGNNDHHNLFFIGLPDLSPRMNHIEFHVRDIDDVLRGGLRMMAAGWPTYMGPGRHVVGSNVFWYLEGPVGPLFEYGCDIDCVDERWEPQTWTEKKGSDLWNLAKGTRARFSM
jgi:catechol 2,3-dioxygenase-like lactoylglutathione lyase family enzyme